MKRFFRASTSAVGLLHLVALFGSIIGIFLVDITWYWILCGIASYYIYNAIGMSMMLHRYYSHRTFEFKYAWTKWLFTAVAVLYGSGSPLAWVYIHRLHHKHTDTEQDPHSPRYRGFRFLGLRSTDTADNINVFLVKDMVNRQQLFINDYYMGFILLWAVCLLLISPNLFYWAWLLPIFLNQVSQDLFNYFAHTQGYRNNETKDDSHNVLWLWFLILGESWHNNHHSNFKTANFRIKRWELDPIYSVIKFVKTN